MPSAKNILVTATLFIACASAHDIAILKRIKDCLSQDGPVVCLKERALDVLNETIRSETPLSLYGVVEVVRDPSYTPEIKDEELPRDMGRRNTKLNDMIYDKVEEYFQSRSLKINLGNMIEGRGKKDKKSGMLMMGGMAMAGMMAQLFMGKIAFMAGAALLVAKLALLLSTIIGFKKLSGGGNGGGSSKTVTGAVVGLGTITVIGLQTAINVSALIATAMLLLLKKTILLCSIYGFGKLKKHKTH